MHGHQIQVESGDRFRFGENWERFLVSLTDARIAEAEESLKAMLQIDRLDGVSFLDIGCGSGLFSMVARRLGARVFSFDYDAKSVACAQALRSRYFGTDDRWTISEGSVLDADFMAALGRYDIVYSWGVLHHTGDMREALNRAADAVGPGGRAFIAIYNDQGWISEYWTQVKRIYNRSAVGRFTMIAVHLPYLLGARMAFRLVAGKRNVGRGMSLWHDMLDWLGGYPFEVAKPEQILDCFLARGFVLERLKTCGGKMGCNEFVLRQATPMPVGEDTRIRSFSS